MTSPAAYEDHHHRHFDELGYVRLGQVMTTSELADLREEAPAAGTAQRDLLDDDEEEEVEVGERTPPLPDELPDVSPER